MDIALWVLQIVVGVSFVASAYAHWPAYERSKARMVWLAAVPRWGVPLIGVVELAGGIGLVLPAATRIAPWLTPLAALLLAILMAFAIAFHLLRREYPNITVNAVLGILAAIVAYGRYVVAPIS